ncbi:hypothetical protein BV25DRAFT_1817987 [Artomyces pyxidatus]|uniref:Uncharacterized protein n=1 Tax=Artomyces pyxidatus TaxID=48021 RepID=A0ACB8TKR5_9AGAM|nr:hypothetical protein BV25DRAFT_1817987 [Artomyces pyxidatus]
MSSRTSAYRTLVREVSRASITPRPDRSQTIIVNFRSIFAQQSAEGPSAQAFDHDVQNAITFLQSQRQYKALLDRYNPLIDLTGEERIEATARRVGLNMPVVPTDDKPE